MPYLTTQKLFWVKITSKMNTAPPNYSECKFLSPLMVHCVMSLYYDAKVNVRINHITGPVFKLLRGVPQVYPACVVFH